MTVLETEIIIPQIPDTVGELLEFWNAEGNHFVVLFDVNKEEIARASLVGIDIELILSGGKSTGKATFYGPLEAASYWTCEISKLDPLRVMRYNFVRLEILDKMVVTVQLTGCNGLLR